jgi:S-layer homology domain
MRKPLGSLALAIPLLAFLPQSAWAQSYGLGQQVLVIGPSEFQPLNSGSVYQNSSADGYVYNTSGSDFHAPLRLPDGALITQMCYYAYDPDGSGADIQIDAIKLPAGGQPAGIIVVADLSESFNIGYGTVCTGALSYTFHVEADLDGMGSAHIAHEVYVNPGGTTTAIGGVRIIWQRQVSPAPGTSDFGDVPTSSQQFPFIEALYAAGVTAGCGGGNYCPNNPVTRGQMAVFLAKALGLNWAQ